MSNPKKGSGSATREEIQSYKDYDGALNAKKVFGYLDKAVDHLIGILDSDFQAPSFGPTAKVVQSTYVSCWFC